MDSVQSGLLERITVDANVRFGKPCIRGHRIAVHEILEWLSSGETQEAILADYPQLEPEDFRAVYAYAAERRHHEVLQLSNSRCSGCASEERNSDC